MRRLRNSMMIAATLVMMFNLANLAVAQTEAVRQLYVSAATVPTNLPGIHTFAEPPSNFNILAATDEELATYGFPPRPDQRTQPDHYKMWERAMLAAKIRWHGELKPLRPERLPNTTGFAEFTSDSAAVPYVPATPTSLNWSGVALTKSLTKWGAGSFSDIYSTITVPIGQPAWGGPCDQYRQLSWIGLNGYEKLYAIQPGNNKSALIGGVWSQAICGGSDAVYQAVFGWEPVIILGAFYVRPGDIFYAEVGAPPGGVNPSYLFMEDLSTLTYTTESVSVPYGVTYVGNTAEWIVERWCCRNSGYPYPLLNTGAVNFDGGAALDGAGHTFYPGSSATSTQVITMRDDNNDQNIELINRGTSGFEGQHALLLQTTGCAWSGGCVEK
jgi:hypothetical protein